MKFEPNQHHSNWVMHVDDHTYFSYLYKHPLGGMWDSDTGGSETAMVLDHKFYILNGDFRKEYEEAFAQGGVQACCEVYNKLAPEHASTWTTDADPVEFLKGILSRLRKDLS